jgi:hypothetical protein
MSVAFIESVRRAQGYGLEQVADFAFVLREHALEDGAAGARSARDEDLLVNGRSGGDDVRLRRKLVEEGTPIFDAIAFDAKEADVGSGS